MQSTGALGNMDPEMAAHRRLMCDKIAHIFRQKRTNVSADYLQRLPDIVKRLELGLYRSAASKDDYLNMETLEARLQAVFRSLSAHNSQLARTASPSLSTHNSQLARASSPSLSTHNSQLMRASSPSLSVHNSQLVRASSPSPANTMIPTPGMSHGISSWRSSTASPAGSNSMSSSNGPANGSLPMGYLQQAPSNASAGQLMPTPGLTVRQSLPPTMLMQQQPQAQQQQHQHQNGGSLHSLGALVGANSRRFSSGGPLISSAVHFMHNGGPVASDDGLETVLQKHQQQQQQQQQQIISVGSDGYGMNTVDLTGDALSYDQSLMNSMSSLQKPGIRSMEMPSPGRAVSMIDNSSLVAPGEHFKYHQQAYGLQQSRQQPIHTQQAYNQFSQLQSTRTQPNDEQEALRMASSPNHSLRMPGFGSDGSLGHTTSQPAVAPLPSLSGLPSEFQPDNLSANFLEAQDLKPGFPQGLPQMHRQTSYLQKRDFELQSEEQDSLSTSSSKPEPLNVSPDERHLFRDEFQQRMIERDAAQRPHYSIGGAVNGSMPGEAGMKMASRGDEKTSQLTRERQYMNQQRWLLFLRHARRCPAPRGKCQEANCVTVQQLVAHMASCKGILCGYPRCRQSKALVKHYCGCRAVDCPVCVPVRVYISKQRKVAGHPECAASDLPAKSKAMRAVETCSDLIQSSLKRMKVDFSASSHVMDVGSQTNAAEEVHRQAETVEMKTEFGGGGPPNLENTCSFTRSRPGVQAVMVSEGDGDSKTEESMQIDRGQTAGAVLEGAKVKKQETSAPGDSAVASTKSGKPKIKGVSLTELFTPEQVREHISSLKRWVGQSKAKAEKNQAIQRSMSENSCQLCAVERLTFDPPPIYCSPCGARIKRNAPYYTIGSGDTRHFFCTHCYNETRGDSIEVEGTFHLKAKLEKKKNDEETEEWWVQCDKCEAWQHQICALFNGRRNDGGEAEYTCPNCYMKEVEDGERAPLPPNAVLGAKDLPGTLLSDHIEQRLFARLKVERQERAKHQGKSVDEVPGVEGLVVRVVSSVDKKLEVKPRFSEMFQEENYPSEFPYKSKVVLLFQNIEGVEVCLFGMYVQEFGAECPLPNQRRVYLSYLDSVKYFRPEIKTTTGEALRTFVYHEILIGYLEYCKKRGFTSCYIWACPPLKGEDYILYCHPEIQKTPKSDKLREWYLAMLRKATRENIVVDLTNLYDHFFMQMGDSRARVTAARLPYFDGDYWPGAAEDMINQLLQEEDDRKLQKKGKAKKIITKRSLKAAGQSDLSGNASKDFLLMQKLGETIFPMKEDFIMVHLQHACSHCCVLMVSGVRWACTQCKKFQLCDRCHDAEVKRDDRERHPSGSREKHLLARVEISDVPEDTKDADEILESEFFDTRQAFLSLCQGNHYQYDTLRRAKHSSMMVLYHLHNPTAPAFVTTCNLCHRDIETGQGWRCEICPDFDVCNNCYQKSGGGDHPHRLTNHPSVAERDAQNKEARQKRVLQLRKMLDLLVHAAQCRSLHCQYPNCRKVKGLFRHGINCRTRASGGCVLCKKMWYLLQLHARACKESNCHVPRCRDLREHLRRLQQQSDSRRRAAVMEMMRQRTAEVSGNV